MPSAGYTVCPSEKPIRRPKLPLVWPPNILPQALTPAIAAPVGGIVTPVLVINPFEKPLRRL